MPDLCTFGASKAVDAQAALTTIIVIDDLESAHHLVRYAAEYLRTDSLVQVYSAFSAQQGLERIQQHAETVRVVLLDARMPHSDGRWLIPAIHSCAPQALIAPFTIDTAAAATMQELGCLDPIPKPISARELAVRIQALLETTPPTRTPTAWYAFVQEHAVDALSARSADRPRLLVAVLSAFGLARLGLRGALEKVAQILPLEILVDTDSIDEVRQAAQRRRLALIIAAPDMSHEAEAIGQAAHVPVLVVATAREVTQLDVAPTTSVVSSDPLQRSDELVEAIERTARGDTVRSEHRTLRLLTASQRHVVDLAAQGYNIIEIAARMNIRRDRVDHILGELYRMSEIPYGWKAFRNWAQRVTPYPHATRTDNRNNN